MENQQKPEQFLEDLNRTRILIQKKFSEIRSILFQRERNLLKELDVIQKNYEIQLSLYLKRVELSKQTQANEKMNNDDWNVSELSSLEDESKSIEEMRPRKRIQFRIPRDVMSTFDRVGAIKVVDENPQTRRRPTYGEERESQQFKLTRRRSKDDFDLTHIRQEGVKGLHATYSAPNLDSERKFKAGEDHPLKKNKIKSGLCQMFYPSKHSSPTIL